MMKLDTMRELTATLNDDWQSPIANEIASRWHHDVSTVRFLRASANFLFVFKHTEQDYMLRFNHASERTIEAIEAEIAFVSYLSGQGLSVAKPVQSSAGAFVESVTTSLGTFHAVVFERLKGEQFDFEELTPEMVVLWGKSLGELHAISQHYEGTDRPSWQDHLAMIAEQLPPNEIAAQVALQQVRAQVSQLSAPADQFGLIHFDFELDNIVWNNNQLSMLDFDDSARYWLVADIAFALRDLFKDSANNVDMTNDTFQHFIHGYRMAKSIDQEHLKRIPLFLTLHNLIMFVKLQAALGTKLPHGEPAWMEAIRNKLLAKMAFYRGEFSKSHVLA